MSSVGFLVTELQSLASETRRRHPEIREAAEKSLSILRAAPEQATVTLASDGPQAEDLLRPVFMGCATKNAKVVAISLGSLQRLISLKAVPQSAVPRIIATMNDAMSQGVDIQLRILQTLVSLVPNFPNVNGSLLGEALLLCFKLQESRIAVVSSTAAATLRQLVMFVVDKMVAEDGVMAERGAGEGSLNLELTEVQTPDGSIRMLGPSAVDAYSVFEDLCLLANSERPHFLNLEFLHKTFALELIESVLTNYHELFRKRNELLLLLRHHLSPLLLKSLSERPQFSLSLRCTRVVFLLVKQFSLELATEAEVFLSWFIRIISDETTSEPAEQHQYHHGSRPHWVRVLAMEVMRGLCNDADLIRNLWDRYDAQNQGSTVVSSLITALKRLVTEKPALLGQSPQMGGLCVHSDSSLGSSSSSASGAAGAAAYYGLDMAGRVASATVSGVAGIIGVGGIGLSAQNSSMKLQCIDQLDKADAPPIPETYIYLLGVQCIVSLCEGFASFCGPIYGNLVLQRPRESSAIIRAPPALDLDSLSQDETQTHHLRITHSLVSQSWPAFLAALSFIIATNLSDEIFVEVLASYQAMANVAGMLGLSTPRDAFFNSMVKFAVPTGVVSSLEAWVEHPPASTPRSATAALTEGLGLSGPVQPPSLSERNMACLKVFIGCALFLAGSLGDSWYAVLEAIQNADGVLGLMVKTGAAIAAIKKGGVPPLKPPSQSHQPAAGNGNVTTYKHPLLSDLDVETLQGAIQRLFDSSKNLEDGAFKDFINALCKLSAEMVGMQSSDAVVASVDSVEGGEDSLLNVPLNQSQENFVQRRRVSGIFIPKNLQKSGDFGIAKLGGVAIINIHRLTHRPADIAWETCTSHLLTVIKQIYAPQTIRIQAARVLGEILLIVPRSIANAGNLQAEVQRRVFEVLSQQVILDSLPGPYAQMSTSVELRRMGLETLHQILQAVGHTIIVGWEIIFRMLESVCRPLDAGFSDGTRTIQPSRSESVDSSSGSPVLDVRPKLAPLQIGLGNPTEKYSTLVKIAFQSLTLVCDSVSSLSPEHLRLCIGTLGQFGRQTDTNIALTAAESLLWSVSDVIQSKRQNIDVEPQYSGLWMLLLLEVLGLCTDSRAEVRDGAIQTLFRTMQLYGATLTSETWDQCIWKVIFPLLVSLTSEIRSKADTPQDGQVTKQTWDESKILAFTSLSSIFSDFLVSKLMLLDSYPKAWDVFVGHVVQTVQFDDRSISPHALRCLEKAINTSINGEGVLKMRVMESLERAWEAVDHLGNMLQEDADDATDQPLTQEALVAYVNSIQSIRRTAKGVDGKEWSLPRLSRLMVILKGVLTYRSSPDFRPDVDALSPVQAVVLNTVYGLDLAVPGSPSLVMRDLSQYVTLAFVDHPLTSQQACVTYIAVCKKAMPWLVDLFVRFKSSVDIYTDGTIEAALSAYATPLRLKYDCPAPSKFGKDPPLWKTATNCFLAIVKECTIHIKQFGDQISDGRLEDMWTQILSVFQGSILADCSSAGSYPLDIQEAEEDFDMALIASLEKYVVPYLGDFRVPGALVAQLGLILQQGSIINQEDPPSPSSLSNLADRNPAALSLVIPEKVELDIRYSELSSSRPGKTVPRERFSYWCFDLLFLICSRVTNDLEYTQRRLATLSLPSLLNRCKATLLRFVADESIRGKSPFPRTREEELVYVLRQLLELRLWPGCFWAALSSNPSQFCVEQPGTSGSTPRELIADSIKRTTIAHLFHFFPLLTELASLPRKSPVSWVQIGKLPSADASGEQGSSNIVELDARTLARSCLKEIGREMGLPS